MAAANTDKLKKLSRKWVGQIGSGGVADAVVTTIPLASATDLPTDTAVVVTINRVDSNGVKTASKEETVIGVVSGSNLVNCVRGSEGTAQAHAAGDVVEILITAKGYNDIIDHLLVQHSQLGVHTSALVTSLKATGAEIDTGESDVKIVTPKAIADSKVSITDKVETLTNKTLTSPKINENVALTATATQLNTVASSGTAFTPAFTNLTVGTGTNTGKYIKVGKLVRFETFWNFNTGGAVSGQITLTLPFTISTIDTNIPIGIVRAIDATDGKTYAGTLRSDGKVYFDTVNSTTIIDTASSATVPFTWASGDYLLISGNYISTT